MATLRPASEPCVQVSQHAAQASDRAHEVDRGAARDGTPAVDENAGRISGGGVVATATLVSPCSRVRIDDRAAARARVHQVETAQQVQDSPGNIHR
jgi:hypothetical protein